MQADVHGIPRPALDDAALAALIDKVRSLSKPLLNVKEPN
jgi:hypothetical protein